MTQATINGNTYSDDGTSARDMLHGGHRTWFLPMVGDVTTVAGVVAGQAAQTAIDAVNAANGAAATKGTSTTSLTVSVGTKTLTTQAGKQFTAGNFVTISRTSGPATMMHGVVTSYSGADLVVEVAISAGSGTYTDWTIALSGPQGATGATGDGSISYLAKTGAYTVTAADKAKLIDCTSGTFALAFQPAATLGATWATWIKNSGTGVVTLDPSASETINGAATYLLYPSHSVLLTCDGAELRVAQDVGPRQMRLPIFSPEAATKTAVSVMEDIAFPQYDTLLTATTSSKVYYGNSLFLAQPSGSFTNISTSPDGETWTLRALPSSAQWGIGTNGTNKFIASAYTTTTIAKSTDGVTWTSGTALPASSQGYNVVFNGNICLIRASATVHYTSSDNGATWSPAQSMPVSMSGEVYSIGGLFWIYSSGTTAYTSPTGATGSWTLRTLPFSNYGSRSYTITGNLCSYHGDAGYLSYETSDGVLWESTGITSTLSTNTPGLVVNGVRGWWSSSFPRAKTIHNGDYVQRISSKSYDYSPGYYATNGSIFVFSNATGISSSKVSVFNPSTGTPTAIFEG